MLKTKLKNQKEKLATAGNDVYSSAVIRNDIHWEQPFFSVYGMVTFSYRNT